MSAAIPFGRLWVAEARKTVDTRAGRGLVGAVVLASAGLVAVLVATGDPNRLTLPGLAALGLVVPSVVVPVLAILTITGEWTRRTAVITFVAEPRRARVVLAKVLVVAAIGAGFAVAVLLFALLGLWLAHLLRGTPWQLSLDPGLVAGAAAGQLIWLLAAVAWALVVQQTTVTIVAFFAVPAAWTTLGLTVPALAGPARWLDLVQTTAPLLAGTGLDAGAVARLGVSLLVGVAVPLVVGLLRWNRREVA